MGHRSHPCWTTAGGCWSTPDVVVGGSFETWQAQKFPYYCDYPAGEKWLFLLGDSRQKTTKDFLFSSSLWRDGTKASRWQERVLQVGFSSAHPSMCIYRIIRSTGRKQREVHFLKIKPVSESSRSNFSCSNLCCDTYYYYVYPPMQGFIEWSGLENYSS
jgi:hypothetical protein